MGKHQIWKFTSIIRVQKRCARLILDASFSDNSVELFSKLDWLPIDDVIISCTRLLMSVALSTLKIISGGGGGGTWVDFCWVCAAGLSEPLPHYSLFCGQL